MGRRPVLRATAVGFSREGELRLDSGCFMGSGGDSPGQVRSWRGGLQRGASGRSGFWLTRSSRVSLKAGQVGRALLGDGWGEPLRYGGWGLFSRVFLELDFPGRNVDGPVRRLRSRTDVEPSRGSSSPSLPPAPRGCSLSLKLIWHHVRRVVIFSVQIASCPCFSPPFGVNLYPIASSRLFFSRSAHCSWASSGTLGLS